jgi:VWFA-related protein
VDGNIQTKVLNTDTRKGRYVTVQFKIRRAGTDDLVTDVPREEIVIFEDGLKRDTREIDVPRTGPLTTILAMDISGSMDKSDKMIQAKKAANLFLGKLHDKADCGLILFDHEMRLKEPPARDPRKLIAHRSVLKQHIDGATPLGGTAYLDAAVEAVQMLEGVQGRKAILVMTDGVDLNSKHKLEQVIELARIAEVPVYTLGVGEPGHGEAVTTVLVLDHSGSMLAKADRNDKLGKIGALKEAASRFVGMIRPGVRTTLLPFSDKPGKSEPFTDSKDRLNNSIQALQAKGETALFDAVYDGLMTLKADTEETQREGRPIGKRAIVAMTDGIDNKSRRRMTEVVKLAKETNTPLYLLGLGLPNQIDEKTMRRMADETGGRFYYAQNQQQLIEVFENLAIQLHDDGIDEASLKELAEKTGGKYYLARNISDLQLMYERVAEDLQSTYRVTFPSWRPENDGTASRVEISIERGGVRISNIARDTFTRSGVVIADMHPGVYLGLLLLLGGLLVLPGGVRRMVKTVGGS